MTIFVGIDGTGELNNAQYARDFRTSFVRYIWRHTPATLKQYQRGPSATLTDLQSGTETVSLIAEGFTFVELAYTEGQRVLLTGYSRGAAAVVAIAQRLNARQIPVAGLVLFDCVDRCPLIDTMRIPANVAEVVHVMRDPRAESRESFNNSGLLASPPTIYNGRRVDREGGVGRMRHFFGTHGALGGVPWHAPAGVDPNNACVDEGIPDFGTRVKFARDLECSREVWGVVHPELCRLGFL